MQRLVEMLRLTSGPSVYSQYLEQSISQSHHFLQCCSRRTQSLKKALEQVENSSEHVPSLYARGELVLYVSWLAWEAIKWLTATVRTSTLQRDKKKNHNANDVDDKRFDVNPHALCILLSLYVYMWYSDKLPDISMWQSGCTCYLSHRLNTSWTPHLSLGCSAGPAGHTK